jgi:hypothetical protein
MRFAVVYDDPSFIMPGPDEPDHIALYIISHPLVVACMHVRTNRNGAVQEWALFHTMARMLYRMKNP